MPVDSCISAHDDPDLLLEYRMHHHPHTQITTFFNNNKKKNQ